MNKEETTKLYYNCLSVAVNFLGAILFYIFPIAYIILNLSPTGIFVVGGFIAFFGTEIFYYHLNNFFRFLYHKPAIELSRECFIDHTKNKVIAWDNFESMFLENRKSITVLRYHLKDKKVFFRQIKNPLIKILALSLPDVTPTFTNLESVKGKNQDLFELIVGYKNKYKESL